MLSVVVNVVAAVALMGPLAHGGLALASSVGAYVNFLALVWAARARFGGLQARALCASAGRTLVASAALAGWCGACLGLWPSPAGRALDAAWLGVTVLGGAAVFWITSALLRSPERLTLMRLGKWGA